MRNFTASIALILFPLFLWAQETPDSTTPVIKNVALDLRINYHYEKGQDVIAFFTPDSIKNTFEFDIICFPFKEKKSRFTIYQNGEILMQAKGKEALALVSLVIQRPNDFINTVLQFDGKIKGSDGNEYEPSDKIEFGLNTTMLAADFIANNLDVNDIGRELGLDDEGMKQLEAQLNNQILLRHALAYFVMQQNNVPSIILTREEGEIAYSFKPLELTNLQQ